MCVEFAVHESTLHQGLAVVKYSIHLYGGYILAESSELALLNVAHFPLWIEDIYMYAFHSQETVGYGRACVTGCCHEHVDLLLAFLADEVLQQPCHEPRAYILECQRRSVEQLKRVYILFHLYGWCVESQRVANYVVKSLFLNILTKESLCHVASHLLE